MKAIFSLCIIIVVSEVATTNEIKPILSELGAIVGIPESLIKVLELELTRFEKLTTDEDSSGNSTLGEFQDGAESTLLTIREQREVSNNFSTNLVPENEMDVPETRFHESDLNQVPEEKVDTEKVLDNEDSELLIEEGRFLNSGCNDAFSAFAFLTFLLTLLDVILELQNQGGRRKRDSSTLQGYSYRESVLAVHSLYRGFFNALAANETQCKQKFICEGWFEASKRGHTGWKIASISSQNAITYLSASQDDDLGDEYEDAMKAGIQIGANFLETGTQDISCADTYRECSSLPPSYRFPGVSQPFTAKDYIVKRMLGETKLIEFLKIAESMFNFEHGRLNSAY